VLGTAQWGSAYGVTNTAGRLTDEEVAAIVTVAREAGIVRMDTAAGYGDAQSRISPWAEMFQITTKVAGAEPAEIIPNLEKCLVELGVGRVDSLLIHDWNQLDADAHVTAASQLRIALEQGLVTRVGVSVYQESGITAAAEAFRSVDVALALIQVPANALDRRLDESSIVRQLSNDGTCVQVRSALLQGLLAASTDTRLGQHPDVQAFHYYAAEMGITSLSAALGHVRALSWAHEVVLGVTSADELTEVLEAWNSSLGELVPAELQSSDSSLIDPRRWT
jgi:aryl-alcohol dehydrogenase-like predicted oxidoreductase